MYEMIAPTSCTEVKKKRKKKTKKEMLKKSVNGYKHFHKWSFWRAKVSWCEDPDLFIGAYLITESARDFVIAASPPWISR